MSRYIDANKLIAHLEDEIEECRPLFVSGSDEKIIAYGTVLGLKSAIAFAKALPTADVVEVRHGAWYHGTEHGAVYAKCSACGRKMNYSCYGYAYCALCGAKMDGERREG